MGVEADIQNIINKYDSIEIVSKLQKIKDNKTEVQTVIISKQQYRTRKQAIDWIKKSKFKRGKIDETEGSFRFRQRHPKDFKPGTFRTKKITEGVNIVIAIPKEQNTSKFHASVKIQNISKFSNLPHEIKSDLDMPIPMNVEIRTLCSGKNRDGIILDADLVESVPEWEGLTIIPFHDTNDMERISSYNISDECGSTDNARVAREGDQTWLYANARITNRNVAYQMYLREKKGQPIEVSAEYRWVREYNDNGDVIQTKIRPGVISLVDKGHIKGNQIKIKEVL